MKVNVLAILLFFGAIILPATGFSETRQQKIFRAKHGAQIEAYKQLAEVVKNVQFDSNSYVRQFITESDQIFLQFDNLIKSAGIIKEPEIVEEPDGSITAKVEVGLSVNEIVHGLMRMNYSRGPEKEPIDFSSIKKYTDKKEFTATGKYNSSSAATSSYDEKYSPADTSKTEPVNKNNSSPKLSGSASKKNMPEWALRTIKAYGVGTPAEDDKSTTTQINTEKAAQTEAKRNLLEQVYGIKIDPTTTIRDYLLDKNEIGSEVSGYVFDAKQSGKPVYNKDGSVEVEVELPLEGVWKIINKK